MRQRSFLPAVALSLLTLTAFPIAALAADFGNAADVRAVRATEEASLRGEIPPVQRDVLAVTVSNVVVAGNYAVCSYSVGESAGYSVFVRSGSKWKRISHGGEEPTRQSLKKLGAPQRSIETIAAHGGL